MFVIIKARRTFNSGGVKRLANISPKTSIKLRKLLKKKKKKPHHFRAPEVNQRQTNQEITLQRAARPTGKKYQGL